MELLILTGLSGSGKTIALHALEDYNCYCTDNLPVELIPALAEQFTKSHYSSNYVAVAVGIDSRTLSEDPRQIENMFKRLDTANIRYKIIFLVSETHALLQRFSETRRKHPLSDSSTTLSEAIEKERSILKPLESRSELHIDTSNTNVHQLRELIKQRLLRETPTTLSVLILSFGFKNGLPLDADFVFDVRCLPNPYWDESLRGLPGNHEEVKSFLEGYPKVKKMYADIIGYADEWLPAFEKDARSYLTLAIGCTGGQHRSVFIAEQVHEKLIKLPYQIILKHRDL